MLRSQIKNWFFEAVRLDMEAPSDLKESLLRGHPRLEGFFDNLTKQFQDAEVILRQKGMTLKKKTIQDTVYDMTKVFMKGMEGEAKKRYETDLQKYYREQEEKKKKEFDDVLAGKAEGEFAEAGVITNEEIDAEREVGFSQEART